MENIYSFLAYMDEEYEESKDFDPTKYQIFDVEDIDGFIEKFDDTELSDLYFWSEFGLRMHVTDIKLHGNTTIDNTLYTLTNFPFKKIIHFHYVLQELIGKESTNEILEQIEKIEKAMIKDIIDESRSN